MDMFRSDEPVWKRGLVDDHVLHRICLLFPIYFIMHCINTVSEPFCSREPKADVVVRCMVLRLVFLMVDLQIVLALSGQWWSLLCSLLPQQGIGRGGWAGKQWLGQGSNSISPDIG